jgi:hypothetical protein
MIRLYNNLSVARAEKGMCGFSRQVLLIAAALVTLNTC